MQQICTCNSMLTANPDPAYPRGIQVRLTYGPVLRGFGRVAVT